MSYVTYLLLKTTATETSAHMATLPAFTKLVPDEHAPEVLLAYALRVDSHPVPEHDADFIGGVVTVGDAKLATLLSLSRRVFKTSRFKCRALLETGPPQSYIHKGAFDQITVTTGAADEPYVPSTSPRS